MSRYEAISIASECAVIRPQSVAGANGASNFPYRTYDSKRWSQISSSDMSGVLNASAFIFLQVGGFALQPKWLICRDAWP